MTNEELKANRLKWIAALRSGKFKQCDGTMHESGAHCCLGVAEILFGHPDAFDYQAVQCSLGLRDECGEMSKSSSLVGLNDGHDDGRKHTFAQIADIIERNMQSNCDGLFAEGTL